MSIFPCEHARRASGKKNTAVSWHGTAPVIAALLEPYIPSCSHIFPGIAGKRGCDGGRRLFQMKKRCSLQRARTTPKSKPNWIINSSGAFVPSTTSLSLQISGYIISRFLNIPIQLSVPMWHLIFKADLFWGRKKKNQQSSPDQNASLWDEWNVGRDFFPLFPKEYIPHWELPGQILFIYLSPVETWSRKKAHPPPDLHSNDIQPMLSHFKLNYPIYAMDLGYRNLRGN